jgi:FMN phosphatase YigB (HAD superfamily)
MDRMSKTIAPQTIGAILFDLGNVLIDIDFFRCARLWSDHAGIPAHVLASRFRIDAEENVQGARKVGMQAMRVDHAHTISQCIRPILADPGACSPALRS